MNKILTDEDILAAWRKLELNDATALIHFSGGALWAEKAVLAKLAEKAEYVAGEEDDERPSGDMQKYAEFWERLPGHLIDNHEGEELTEEMLQRAAADLYEKFPDLVSSGLKPFGLLLLEERATSAQLVRALREATEQPTFMGEPVIPNPPNDTALLAMLTAGCNYIDTLGGDSKSYRAAIEKYKEQS